MKVILILLGSLALLVAVVLLIGSSREKQSTSQLLGALLAGSGPQTPADYRRLDGLPGPVRRYLRHVLRNGQPPVRVARLEQVGELRADVESSHWSRFVASQTIAPMTPGFVWDARVSIAPFVHVRVRDAYVAGQGSGRVSLLSAIAVAGDSARPEMNSGSLHRYLAEAVWYPTALVPSSALKWNPISNNAAMANFTDNGITVSLEFRFNDADEVTGIYSPGRWGNFGGKYRQRPWEGHFASYREIDGMLVPSRGEVGWYSSSTWLPVWKGEIIDAHYAFAR